MIHDLPHCRLQRESCSLACPPGESGALALRALSILPRICTGLGQKPVEVG